MPPPDSDEGVPVATAPSPEEQTPLLPPPRPLADPEHPWLGLESFREETRAYFFGRNTEIAELHLRLRSDPLLVLYGRSGLGKTSILLAGLIPRLRSEGQRPLLLRLWYGESAQDVTHQLVSAVFGWGDRQSRPIRLEPRPTKSLPWVQRLSEELRFSLPEDFASRLWLRLHYRDEPPDITHLILDQFEEVFTLGARQPGAEASVRDNLAILLQGAVPEPISRLISEHARFSDHFDPDSVPVRVILALRSDYVYALNRWRRHLPAVGQNSFELRALRGPGALEAVLKPGELRCQYRGEVKEDNRAETGLPPIITEATAERIVRFIAQKGEEVSMEEIEAVPPILSLLCRELNERRFIEPAGGPETRAAQITFREGEADIETIIAAFYERCLAGRPEAVSTFIEEALVSLSGARVAQDENAILRVFTQGCAVPGAGEERHADGFGDAVAARACLEELVNQRLLSSLGGSENPSYELVHDLLATVVERRRTARKERLEKEAADRRADAERKAKQDAEASAREAAVRAAALDAALQKETQARREADLATRRARRFAVAAILVAFIAVAAFVAAIAARAEKERQRAVAQQAKERAVASRKAADELINFMQYDLRDTLGTLGKLSMMERINARIMKYHQQHPSEPGDEAAKDAADRERSVALDQQGDILQDQGDLTGALKSYRESLGIREKLAEQDPGNAGWQRDLSVSYEKVGGVLEAQGDLTGALKSYRESLEIREKLAKQDPGDAGWQRDLSVSYEKAGDVQSAQGELSGALKSYRESLGIREKLAKQDPGNAGWQRDLSVSYQRVGNVQSAQGELSGALKSYRDSLAIREKLAKQDPGNAGWQFDLASARCWIGIVLQEQGKLAEAIVEYRAYQGLMEDLTQQDPGNAGWQRDLSVSYEKAGDVQGAQGDLAGGLKSYRDSLRIREKLAEQDSSNAGWQRDLSISYEKVGGVLKAQGDLAGALKSYRESLGIREKLAKQDPGNAGWQFDLARARCWIGIVLQEQGKLAEAIAEYRAYQGLMERLTQQDPGNTGWQRDLSVSYEKVGDVQSAQGDLTGALKSYRGSLGIREKLAEQDPSNAGWQRDLSVSHEKVGDAQSDLTGALKSYRESLGIREKLAKQDPGNAGWQRDLSISYNKVGDVLEAQGDLTGALKSYRNSLGISEKLAKQDSENAGWQSDLAWVCWRTGSAWVKAEPNSKNEARAMVEKGRDILRQLKERTGLNARQQGWLDSIQADLQGLQEKE